MSKKHEALFYTVKDMCEIIQTSRSSLYRMINSGVLQQPQRLTSRSVVWYREDINNWAKNYSQIQSTEKIHSKQDTITSTRGDRK
jgi:predicted DNA-binding transcriptional regulator AlpA